MESRRKVTVVIEQKAFKGAKARMSAFGILAIATVAKCSMRTVERAVEAGTLDMESMESVLMWVEERKPKQSKP